MREQLYEYLDHEMEAKEESCQISREQKGEEQVRIEMIQEYVARREYENLNLIVRTIPLDNMTKVNQDVYLIYLLRLAFEIQDPIVVKIALDVWQEYNPGEFKYPVSTSLYLVRETPEFTRILSFMDSALQISYSYHIYKLVSYDSSPQISVAVDRLEKIYGSQPADTYKTIYDFCLQEYENTGTCNTELLCIMEEKYRELAKVAVTPVYMIYDDPIYFPFHDELVEKIKYLSEGEVTEEEIREYVSKHLEMIPEEAIVGGIEEAKKKLIETLHSMDNEEKMKHSRAIQMDTELFRTFGPANPGILEGGVAEETGSPCMKYGLHRMLVCTEHENFDEEGEILNEDVLINQDWSSIEWFRGSCDNCMKVILFKQRSARMPILDAGGWKGCYCSWQCVIEDVAPGPESKLLITLIKQYSNMCDLYGIYERHWNRGYKDISSPPRYNVEDLEGTRHLELEPSEFGCCSDLLFQTTDVIL